MGCFIALNISVGSYIKHSLYSKLPFIYLFILPRASSGLYNSMLSTLAVHFSWTKMQTWWLKPRHSAYMQPCLMIAIRLLTWSYIYTALRLETGGKNLRSRKEEHNARKTTWKSSCSIVTMGVNCKETFF